MKYIATRRNCSIADAIQMLRHSGHVFAAADQLGSRAAIRKPEIREKPELPGLLPLNQDGIMALAKLRCLSPAGIRLAIDDGVLFGCRWPIHRSGQHQSWCITDADRKVAQFRRFDGEPYLFEGRAIKAWTKGRASWPVGLCNVDGAKVMLVEGGPDFITAYHFLGTQFKIGRRSVTPEFSPVAMLGASCKIAPDALPVFERKRVRILRHNDESGLKAAAMWTEQLAMAGAAVETCSLSSLSDDRTIRRAFLDFDF